MKCILCKSEKFKKVHEHDGGRALFRCYACGLIQTSPMPTPVQLSEYYQRYDILGEREPYYRAMWGADALKTPEGRGVRDRFNWSLKHSRNLGKILDIGSGPGLFLRLAKESGANPVGVELNAKAAERCARELGLKVVAGSIDEIAENDFDTLTLWDLIEHVPDPVKLVVECGRHLKNNGWLFLETPDEGALLDRIVLALSRLGIKGPASIFYGLHHLVLFRPKTIRRLLEKNGFKVVEIIGAETEVGRIFRGNGFKDKMTRLGLGGLFLLARLVGRQNKMLIAARKE